MAEIPMLFGAHILGFRDRVILLRDRIRALTRWKNMGFLLAIGDMGAAWYRKAWYPEKKIFPFAYFLDETKFVEKEPMAFKLEGVFRILFVGRLVRSEGRGRSDRGLSHLAGHALEAGYCG